MHKLAWYVKLVNLTDIRGADIKLYYVLALNFNVWQVTKCIYIITKCGHDIFIPIQIYSFIN